MVYKSQTAEYENTCKTRYFLLQVHDARGQGGQMAKWQISCLSNAVKPRSKEMLWLVERLMAHDLPWKFFSERYWNCLIKRAILVPTSASTCTDIKGEVPYKPMRDAAQLGAPGLAFKLLQHWVRQLWATAAPIQNSEPIQHLLMQAVHPSWHERMETVLTEEICLRWNLGFLSLQTFCQ